MFQQDPPDLVRANVAQRHQHLQVGIACQAESLPRRREVGAKQAQPTQLPVEHVLAGRFVACAVELVEPAADLLARAAAGEEAIGLHQPVTTRLAAGQPQRTLPVEWGRAGSAHEVDVELVAVDRKWLLKEVTNLIAQGNAHLTSIHGEQQRNDARVRFLMRLKVDDYGQLSTLLGKLAALPGVEHARRA